MKILPGLSFSWKRAVGLTRLQTRLSRKLGVPLSRGGREKKLGAAILRALFGRRH